MVITIFFSRDQENFEHLKQIAKLGGTAKVYKVQFISMILLIALGIGVFVGFNAEWVTIKEDTGAFFEDCGFADYRIIDEDGISSADVDKIRALKEVSGVSRFLSVNADVKGSTDQLALTISESEHTSGFVLMSGDEYDRWDENGFWLMDRYAELNGVGIGPDEMVVLTEDSETDVQLDKAMEILQEQLEERAA